MLRADNDKLRLRIKCLKETQDSKDEVIAELRAKALCADMTGKQPIRTRYLGHVTGHQPIRDQDQVFEGDPG